LGESPPNPPKKKKKNQWHGLFLVDTRYTNLEKVPNIGIGSQVGRSWKTQNKEIEEEEEIETNL
jgi:hypothetical protein